MTGSFKTTKRYVISLFLIMAFLLAMIPGQKGAEARIMSVRELKTIVAPVALYPDDLLSNVLVASTVPEEVVEATMYLKDNGGQVTTMPATDWDPSVKALLYYPEVLYKMDNDLSWTQTLGYAVINQQQDVMRAVQAYRDEVYRAGNLRTNRYERVVYTNDVVEIVPAVADQYYVPVYNPEMVVYEGNPVADFLFGVLVGDWWHR